MAQEVVERAEITVAYVNPPKEGKKWGNVKDTQGNAYFGPPAMLAKYSPGETCKIEYTLGGNDGTLKSLKRKIEIPQALQRPQSPPQRGRTDDLDAERMFVAAMLKAQVEREGSGTVTEMIVEVNKWRDVYRNTFGAPTRDEQLGDEIQF